MATEFTASWGRDSITIETGKWAKQAHGSVVYKTGNLVLLATVCAADEPKDGQDFFPLTCEYTEKMYSVGRFPGGYFKREAKPPEHEILLSRIIDRPIRPMFPEGYFSEVQLLVQVLSADKQVSVAGHAITAASAALSVSTIPFAGPIAGARIGRLEGQFILNPTNEEMSRSDLDLVVAGTKDAIVMIEGEAAEISKEDMMAALRFAQEQLKIAVEMQESLAKQHGTVKKPVVLKAPDKDLLQSVRDFAYEKLNQANRNADKAKRNEDIKKINEETVNHFKEVYAPNDRSKEIKHFLHELEYEVVRELVLGEGIRFDGRRTDEIRQINCEIDVLPGPHGSAVFTRGQTQSLGVVTLGTSSDNQRYETLEGQKEKLHVALQFPCLFCRRSP